MLIGSQLLNTAAEREFEEYIDQIRYLLNTSIVLYYLLALFTMYFIIKSGRSIRLKIIIAICILVIVPPVSMIMFLVIDGEIIPAQKMITKI